MDECRTVLVVCTLVTRGSVTLTSSRAAAQSLPLPRQHAGLLYLLAPRREVSSGGQTVWLKAGRHGRSRASQQFKVFLTAA